MGWGGTRKGKSVTDDRQWREITGNLSDSKVVRTPNRELYRYICIVQLDTRNIDNAYIKFYIDN